MGADQAAWGILLLYGPKESKCNAQYFSRFPAFLLNQNRSRDRSAARLVFSQSQPITMFGTLPAIIRDFKLVRLMSNDRFCPGLRKPDPLNGNDLVGLRTPHRV